MAGMEVGGEEMDEGEDAEFEQDVAEAEKGGSRGTLLSLEATGILTQDADPGGTTLTDSCNGFNEMNRLAMLCTVRCRWPAGERFAFN